MKRKIFTDRKWPYWIPDPFNMAFLGGSAMAVLIVLGFAFAMDWRW